MAVDVGCLVMLIILHIRGIKSLNSKIMEMKLQMIARYCKE